MNLGKLKKISTILIIFLLCLRVAIDIDTGWHIRVGEWIIKNRAIPKYDLFSYTMPDYPYIYHSWGTETLLYASYKLLGIAGVSIFYALLLALSLVILFKTAKRLSSSYPNLVFIMASTLIAYTVAGNRTRLLAFLATSAIYYLLNKYEKNQKKLLIFVPAAMMLFANLHGSFPQAIVLIAVFFLFSKLKYPVKLLTLSIIASLINPYTYKALINSFVISKNSITSVSQLNPDWRSLAASQFSLVLLPVFILIIAL